MQAQCLNNYFRSQGLASKANERRNGILIDRAQMQWDKDKQ
jgi:hypothetical protein